MGPVLVIAGPGAGKTFCLIGRVKHLIAEHGLPPARICAVTFTNKAAEEIAARLKGSLGPPAEDITRGTLHSLCVGVLREHGAAVGVARGFGIADELYQQQVLRRLGVHTTQRYRLLSAFGRRRLQDEPLPDEDETLFLRYNAILTRRNMLDFDDIIARTAKLFRDHPEVAQTVGARWDYVLVDEFQDLNQAQYFVLTALVRAHRNFFAVGDEEQSIFSWTGADPEVLRKFQEDYQILEPIVLDTNRRCSRQIFETARTLLALNPSLFDKQLTAERESPHPVRAVALEDDAAEARWILADLSADRAETERKWGEYAILYRRHLVGEALERWLVRNGIPCRLARGKSLTDDPVIKYVVASLRLVNAPGDPIAVEVFAEQVLPEALIAQVRALAGEEESLVSAMRAFAAKRPKRDLDAKKIWRFIYHIENLDALYKSHSTLLGFVEELLAQRVGKYRNALEERHDELSDPAEHPDVVQLAETLRAAMAGNARVHVAPAAGLEIALRGMLRSAGVSTTPPGGDGEGIGANAGDVTLTADDGGTLGLPLRLFKALQLVQSEGFRDVFDSYVAFDLETTDKDVAECDIVEIGAVRVRGGAITERFHVLVRPSRPISAGAREVHGYSDDDLKDALPLEQVWPEFRAFVDDDVLVAHNGQLFDVPVLRRCAAGLGGVEDMVFFDTLPLARSLFQDSARLSDLAERFGIDPGRAHHAADDAETLAAVFRALGARKIVRARKSVLVNLLDYVGLALVLDSETPRSEEHEVVRDISRPFTLGRFSDCLEFYAAERERTGSVGAPHVDEVIRRLGGQDLMDRIRATKAAAQRYPVAMARLAALIEASPGDSLPESILQFLERVALSTSQGAEVDPHRVNLLTLHSTKGLEFSRVYVVGVEDYQIPGYYAVRDNRQDEIEEARRLLYVGMTRAEDRLVLTRVDRRGGLEAGGSRFLEEMGLEVSVIPSVES